MGVKNAQGAAGPKKAAKPVKKQSTLVQSRPQKAGLAPRKKPGPASNLPRFKGFAPAAPKTLPRAMTAYAAAPAPTTGTPQKTPFPQTMRLRAEGPERKVALGDPNRVGRAINHIQGPKNLRSVQHTNDASKIEKLLSKVLSPEQCLSPDARRYAKLLQNPLTAEWGDEGEHQVKPLLYDGIVPPMSTLVVRQFGQMTVRSSSAQAGGKIMVVLCGGAGNQQADALFNRDVDSGSDVTRFAHPNVSSAGGSSIQTQFAGKLCYTLGAPRDGRAINNELGATGLEGGGGVAGYWYHDLNPAAPPTSDLGSNQSIDVKMLAASGNAFRFSVANLLQWGSPVPLGGMKADDSSVYKYRPVAFGIQVTPVDAELSVGGQYNISVVPQATNDAYFGASLTPGNTGGVSTGIQDFYALPDHMVERADSSVTAAWLPGRQDYSFLQTHSLFSSAVPGPTLGAFPEQGGAGATDLPVTTGAANARFVVEIIPPPQTAEGIQIHAYVLSYVGFYEVAGQCIQTLGTVPRPQPTLGAKMATAVQDQLMVEVDDRTTSLPKAAAFEVAKDHPVVGPMIEDTSNANEAKSLFSEVIDFGKELLPLVTLLL